MGYGLDCGKILFSFMLRIFWHDKRLAAAVKIPTGAGGFLDSIILYKPENIHETNFFSFARYRENIAKY